jgi:protein-ribulosamine 3-kinase
VVSADKDLAQVLREGDVLLDPARGRRLGYRDVPQTYGVRAEQIVDLLALMGDAVDNIPGVPGIGQKTAVSLLSAFADLDEIYAHPERIATLKLRGASRVQRVLAEHRDTAMLARQLATIAEDADVEVDAGVLRRRLPDLPALGAFYDQLGVGTVLRKQAQQVHAGMQSASERAPAALPLFRPVPADQPADWYAIADAVSAGGGPTLYPEQVSPVSGGCINGTFRVRGDSGWYFVKRNDAATLSMFEAEAAGLRALADAGVVRVPRPVRCGTAGDCAFLLLEWIELKRGGKGCARQLGTALAALHRVSEERFGWHDDNYIGASPQRNEWTTQWPEFFAEQRLAPQLAMAAERGQAGRLQQDGARLLAHIDQLFADYRPRPSLLHGDLWAGNHAADEQGRPVLFDPAVHFGDRECDLAMTELFGGFDKAFYRAYDEAWPRAAGYEQRRDLYQLYHVLNHFNLFGGGYLGHAERLLHTLSAAVG